MITVGHLAPMGCWDVTMLMQLLDNELYDTGHTFKHVEGYPNTDDGCLVVIPGRYWFEKYDEISEALARYPWVLAFRTGDEEDLFDLTNIAHPNIRWWVQTPRMGINTRYGTARRFGCGWTPAFNRIEFGGKDLDVFLSCQNTHKRRNQAFVALDQVRCEKVVQATKGFTQGFPPDEYAAFMARAKIAPCPSGVVSPDSFRVFEALQAHAIPLADDVSPRPDYYASGFWHSLFPGGAPFPLITTYEQLPGYVADQLALWPANSNRITAWFMRYKRELSQWLRDDIAALT